MRVTHEALRKRHIRWKAIRFALGQDVRFVMGMDWASVKFSDVFFQPAYPTSLVPQSRTQPIPLLAQYWGKS
jgi:hypothetical protein